MAPFNMSRNLVIHFSLSSGTKYPLPVVTVILRIGEKHRATIFSFLTCLWVSGATNSMIKRRHTKLDKRNIRFNKLEYSTDSGPYCTTHDIKVPFFMP